VNANNTDGLAMATTPDGNELIVVPDSGQGDVKAYSLPSLRLLWTSPVQASQIKAVGAARVLVYSPGDGFVSLVALDAKIGRTAWSVKFQTAGTGIAGALCDLTSTPVLVANNGQLATLDAATGKQLSYRSDPLPA
jgi:outer membrane protein assembly factor BamB